MALKTTFTRTGTDEAQEKRITHAIANALGPRARHWYFEFIGGLPNSVWELRASGPSGNVVRRLERPRYLFFGERYLAVQNVCRAAAVRPRAGLPGLAGGRGHIVIKSPPGS